MIISTDFEGDSNDVLKNVQHDTWFRALADIDGNRICSCHYIFNVARGVLIEDLSCYPLLYEYDHEDVYKIKELTQFDHRVLQSFHDQIASYYRWITKNEIPPRFKEDEVLYIKYLINNWVSYLSIEIAYLCHNNLDIAENLVRSVYYANLKKGYESENLLNNHLISLYQPDYFDAVKEYRLKRG